MNLRPYQIEMKRNTYRAFNSGAKKVMLQSATGSGKTVLFSSIASDALKQNKKVMILAHRGELVQQAVQKLANFGHKSAVIKSGMPYNPHHNLQVASVQSLVRREMPKGVDLIITDEAHHSVAGTYRKIYDNYPDAWFLGVTATPIRTSGEGFDDLFEELILGPSVKQLIEDGYLAKPKLYVNPLQFDLSNVKTTAGDYNDKQLAEIMKQNFTFGNLVDSYKRLANGLRTIVFAVNVEHSQTIVELYNKAGIPAAHLDGKSKESDRHYTLERFKKGEIKVLSNCQLFDEGFDCLSTDTEILTPQGWKSCTDEFDECYAWDHENNNILKTKVLAKKTRPLRENEKFLEIKSQHTDIKVTDNHRIYYKDVNYYKYGTQGLSSMVSVETARDLYDQPSKKFALPLNGFANLKGLKLSDDELRILGWYMTDGYLGKRGGFSIYQMKQKHVIEIRNILERLGWTYSERLKKSATGYSDPTVCHEFYIYKKSFRHLLPFMNKQDPPAILNNMTREQFLVLYEAMMDGNGSRQENKSGTMTTRYKGQADFITAAATLRGYASMYGTYETQNGVTMYSVRVRDRQWMRFYQKDKRGAEFTLTEPMPREMVWCVSNQIGTLITRRNGKVVILGNCPDTEAVQLARPTQSLGKYLQMVGRGMRPAAGKDYCIVLDHADCIWNHGVPHADRKWSLKGKKKRKKGTNPVMARDINTGQLFERNSVPESFDDIELIEINENTIRQNKIDKLVKIVEREGYKTQKGTLNYMWAWRKFVESNTNITESEVDYFYERAGAKIGWNERWKMHTKAEYCGVA